MPQQNKIDVIVYPADQQNADIIDGIPFTNVNYISFVSSPGGAVGGTYGIPAMLSDSRVKGEGLPVKILYINPANIVAMEATRKA